MRPDFMFLDDPLVLMGAVSKAAAATAAAAAIDDSATADDSKHIHNYSNIILNTTLFHGCVCN